MKILELIRKNVDESNKAGDVEGVLFLDYISALVCVTEGVRTLLEDSKKYDTSPMMWTHTTRKRLRQLEYAMQPLLEEVQ